MSRTTFQDANAKAEIIGQEYSHLFRLCYEAAESAGVIPNLFRAGPMLNAGIKTGDDTMILAVRVFGQSEAILFVEGKNRAWLAEIIESGRSRGLLRADMGWEGVVTLLRSSDSEPVVVWTSLGEEFPNMWLPIQHKTWTPSGSDDDERDDLWEAEWESLAAAEQWTLAVNALRARERPDTCGWELKPDEWRNYHFAIT